MKKILFVFSIVVLLAAGCNKSQQTGSQSSASVNTKSASTSISSNKDYKKVISLNFDRGNGAQQLGAISSIYTDNNNNLYLLDFQNDKVVSLNSEGKQLSVIKTEKMSTIAVDDNGNIYGSGAGSLPDGMGGILEYNNQGKLLSKVDNSSAFSATGDSEADGVLFIAGNTLYSKTLLNVSYAISPIGASLKTGATKIDGIYGMSGKRYKIRVNFTPHTGSVDKPISFDQLAYLDIFDKSGQVKTTTLKIHNLVEIRFLGEDQAGNFYLFTSLYTPPANDPNFPYPTNYAQVRKFDASGNQLATIDVSIPQGYSGMFTTGLHVDQAGNVWQAIGNDKKMLIEKWSTAY